MLLGVIGQATKDELKGNIDETMSTVFKGLQVQHKRKTYAALHALGMLSTDLAPFMQKKYHAQFMPALIQLMAQDSKKVQTQAVSATLNFVQGLVEDPDNGSAEEVDGREILAPYTQTLFQSLVALLRSALAEKNEPLTTECLNVVHSVCNVILADFGVYFNDFMPMMQSILENIGTASMQEKKLRAKAIDTIGSIIIAVSDSDDKEPFMPGVKLVTEVLARMMQAGFSDDDPQDEAIKNTLTQSAAFLRQDFNPFMDFLIQNLMKDMKLEVDFKMENADMPSTSANAGFNVKVKGLGEQRVSVKTENLVKKTTGFGLLEQLSENMAESFAQWAPSVMACIAEHMTYAHSH